MADATTLKLAEEHKLGELLGEDVPGALEASGVCVKGGRYYVIFDNLPHIASLGGGPPLSRADAAWHLQPGHDYGYEDIAYAQGRRRFYMLIEAQATDAGVFRPKIDEYDARLRFLESRWLDFDVAVENKGLEGLCALRRGGQDYLLGLCEGNKCRGGQAGRKPGGGRIQIFRRTAKKWKHVGRLKLPKAVRFEDYAALDARGRKVAVVSQASAALWVGTLSASEWTFVDDGAVYPFPANAKGKTVYCNVEGVAWLSASRVVAVSDQAKSGKQAKRCRQTDQSIHIFDLPERR